MKTIIGCDIGLINLSFCRVSVNNEFNNNTYPELNIEAWRIINLATNKLEESIPILWNELHKDTNSCFINEIDAIIIERQVSKSNPKMCAISHAIQSMYIALGIPSNRIFFENASYKFTRALKRGIALPNDVKDKKYNTPGKKRTATKNNAIWLAEQVCEYNNYLKLNEFKSYNKKTRENLADSLLIIIGWLWK